MIKPAHVLLILMFDCVIASAQSNEDDSLKGEHEMSMEMCVFRTPVLYREIYGFNMAFKYYITQRYASGFEISILEKSIKDTFSYSIQEPLLTFCEFAWLNQFDLVRKDYVRFGFDINTGLAVAKLADDAIKEEYYTEYGYEERPKEIASSYFFLLEPGAVLSIKLFHIRNFADFYLGSKIKYRFVFGNSKFGETNDFKGSYLGIGFSLTGF